MINPKEQQRFLRTFSCAEILTTATQELNLESIKNDFGLNFNTCIVTNLSTQLASITLDGKKQFYIEANGGQMGLQGKDGIIFSEVVLNNEGAGTINADEIKLVIGRTKEED